MSIADYSAGRRVYNGASNAPTRGTVDPMGYIDRSLNNPSQRRSGLAQAAMTRLGRTSPAFRNTASAGLREAGTNGATATRAPLGPAGQMPPRPIAVSPTGTLSPGAPPQVPYLAQQGNTGLPFDAQAADEQMRLQQQKNRFESDATSAEQDLEREYVINRRNAERQMPEAQRGLLENFAGRGMAFSSGYATEQADQQGQFADLFAQLDGDRSSGLADLLRQRGLFNDEYGSSLQGIQAAAARRLAQQAGDLNLQGIKDAIMPGARPVGSVSPINLPGVARRISQIPRRAV